MNYYLLGTLFKYNFTQPGSYTIWELTSINYGDDQDIIRYTLTLKQKSDSIDYVRHLGATATISPQGIFRHVQDGVAQIVSSIFSIET